MPQKIQQADGTEIEVATPEELAAKDEAIQKAQDELTKINEELAKLQAKDLNFSKLREQKDSLEGKVKQIETDFTAKLEQTKKELFEGVLKDHYSDALKSLAGEDPELQKKVEYHYNRLSDKTTSKAEVDKKLRDAWALAQDKPASSIGQAFSSGGMGYVKASSSGPKSWSKEEIELGKQIARAGNLILKDEDFLK